MSAHGFGAGSNSCGIEVKSSRHERSNIGLAGCLAISATGVKLFNPFAR
jgi:hypothetical protein